MMKRLSPRAKLTLCVLDSLCDRTRTSEGVEDVPFWRSFAHAKRELRNRLEHTVLENATVGAVSINVSTINTESERDLRPNADWRFWLTPSEVVEASWQVMLFGTKPWYDVDVYKINPGFDVGRYYFNLPEMWARWKHEMGSSFGRYALRPRKLSGNH